MNESIRFLMYGQFIPEDGYKEDETDFKQNRIPTYETLNSLEPKKPVKFEDNLKLHKRDDDDDDQFYRCKYNVDQFN